MDYELSDSDYICEHGISHFAHCDECHAESVKQMFEAGYHYCGSLTKKGSECHQWSRDGLPCHIHA